MMSVQTYLPEHELDAQIERIRSELQSLLAPEVRNAEDCTEAAIVAGETLTDMAQYWNEALPEERRDIVWALLTLGSLIYDLERCVIARLLPRVDMLLVMGLGLASRWEQRGDGLWLRDVYMQLKIERDMVRHAPYQRQLTPEQCRQARALVAAGKSLRAVAAHFEVSRVAIWRSIRGMDDPPAPEEGS